MAIKTTHTATGQSDVHAAHSSCAYYADFTTGSGSGSAQLQVNIGGDWLPADDAVTATMTTVEATDKMSPGEPLRYRWNVTVSSGSIITYMG